jgi:hypothetical protein
VERDKRDVENDLREVKVNKLRQEANNRQECVSVAKNAKIRIGLKSQAVSKRENLCKYKKVKLRL